MDWGLTDEEARSGEDGVRALLRRLGGQLSSLDAAIEGSTFLTDGREMLRISRVFEHRLAEPGASGTLYVGFQNPVKLDHEVERYRTIRRNGVRVYAFGESKPGPDAGGAVDQWYSLSRDTRRLENQWYLVMRQPEPFAFVGWEVSDDSLWGEHGVTYPGKRFVGFVSEDTRLVMAIVAHLDSVRASAQRPAAGPGSLSDALSNVRPKKLGLLVDDGKREHVQRVLDELRRAEAAPDCEYYLYDLAAASYLVDPYPYPNMKEPFEAERAVSIFGRKYLQEQMERFAGGRRVLGILPTGVGFGDLAVWAERVGLDALVLPSEYERPGLMDQARGYTLRALRSVTRASVILAGSDGVARVLRPTT
jgi:hypothetical protein